MAKPRQQDRVVCSADAGPAENAHRALPPAITGFFARFRESLAQNPAPADLHPLRLAAKRLRYTLELFRPCYGPGLETRIEALRKLQTALGDINDAGVAARIVTDSMAPSAQRTRVLAFLERRAARKALEFRKYWAVVFDAPGQEAWWTAYLARNARTPGRQQHELRS